jgi:hypothetical protein
MYLLIDSSYTRLQARLCASGSMSKLDIFRSPSPNREVNGNYTINAFSMSSILI